MPQIVSYSLVDTIGVISINNPPVNALSQSLRAELLAVLASAQTDASKALLLICEGQTFIAGADITEFGKPPVPPTLRELLDALEGCPKPIVAAIHGTALGGGLELALACHYRCAVASASVGLPEVKLGLLPGAGGTQRLPRVAGVEAALDLMTSGNPLSARQAAKHNIIDEVIEGDLRTGSLGYIRRLLTSAAPVRRIRDIRLDPGQLDTDFFGRYRSRLNQRSRGQIAPGHIVSCVEAAVTLPFDEGLQREGELFQECLQSTQSRAMRHVFFAQREAGKLRDLAPGTSARDIQSVAVIGAGTMGVGIAMCFADVAIPVTLLEVSDDALARGVESIRANYDANVRKGRMTESGMLERRQLIRGTTDYRDLADVDLVIEAVFENPDIKKQVFARLDAICKPGAILASNTSYQNVDDLAAMTQRPQDVLGMHFFSPANVMKLLEVVRGKQTADDALLTAMQIGRKIGKIGVVSRVCYGFIGNRMLTGYLRQAHMLLLEGATPRQVDSAAEEFGMAMGPLAMSDLAGLDVGYKAREARREAGEQLDPRTHCIASALVEQGRLGQKTVAGYYRYDASTASRQPDPEVESLIRQLGDQLGIVRRDINNAEIVARLFYPLINEGARILEEGIAQRPGDIDVVYIYGYGFPRARGGPMYYADQVGLGNVYDTLCRFRDELGAEYWQPAPLLQRLALAGGRFNEAVSVDSEK